MLPLIRDNGHRLLRLMICAYNAIISSWNFSWGCLSDLPKVGLFLLIFALIGLLY